jgi:hypothetical protein
MRPQLLQVVLAAHYFGGLGYREVLVDRPDGEQIQDYTKQNTN